MTIASHQIVHVLEHLVKVVPIGTNRALLQLMWAIVSGAFLHSWGAVHSALQQAGFMEEEIRRAWLATCSNRPHRLLEATAARLVRLCPPLAQRLLPAITFAVVVEVGQVASQRLPLLRKLIRADSSSDTEAEVKQRLLAWVQRHLAPNQAAICDTGVQLHQIQAAGIRRFVLRRAKILHRAPQCVATDSEEGSAW
jgi:hypothetical protein